MNASSHDVQTCCPQCGSGVRAGMLRCRECGLVLGAAPQPVKAADNPCGLAGMLQSAPTAVAEQSAAGSARSKTSERPGTRVSRSSGNPTSADCSGTDAGLKADTTTGLRPRPVAPPEPPGASLRCACGRNLKIKPELHGKKVKCPACRRVLLAPSLPPARAISAQSVRMSLAAAIAAVRPDATLPDPPAAGQTRLSWYQFAKLRRALVKQDVGDEQAAQRRRLAAEALGTSGDPRAAPLLLPLLGDEFSGVREAAATALGKLHDARAVVPLIQRLADDHGDVKRAACVALGGLGDSRSVLPLVCLSLEDPQLRFSAAEAVARLREAAVGPLLEIRHADDPEMRLAVTVALGKIQDPLTALPLCELVDDPQPTVRAHVAEALGKIGGRETAAGLLRLLNDSEPAVRANAVAGLGKLAESTTVPHLIRAMHDPHAEVRARAASAVCGLKDPRACEPLLSLLHDPDPELRGRAASALGELGDPRALQPLLKMAIDAQPLVRLKVVSALGDLGDPAAVETLLEMLHDSEEKVRQRAAEALGVLQDPRAIPGLGSVLGKGRVAETRMAAAKSLGQIGDPQALAVLQDALQDEVGVRCRVVIALKEIGNKRALPALMAMLRDGMNEVRYHAAVALGDIGDANARRPLELLLKTEDDLMVRRGAAQSLQKLGDPRAEKLLVGGHRRNWRSPAKLLARFSPDSLYGVIGGRAVSSRTAQIAGAAAAVVLLGWIFSDTLGRAMPQPVIRAGGISALVFTPDGQDLIVGHEYDAISIVEMGTGSLRTRRRGHAGGTLALDVAANAERLASGGSDRTVRIWDGGLRREPQELRGHTGEVVGAAFNPAADQLITASMDGLVVTWNVSTGAQIAGVKLPDAGILCRAFTPDLKLLATGTRDGAIHLLDVATGKLVRSLKLLSGEVAAVAISPDGKLIAAAGDVGGPLVVASLNDVTLPPAQFAGHKVGVRVLGFSADSQRVVSAALDGSALVWDLKSGESISLQTALQRFDAIAFSPDGKLIVGGGIDDNEAIVWSSADGTIVKTLLGN